ncbi:hypothetical protein SP90_12370 [Halodesulfovibrio spirochaetisodalis]|uniref:Uncharacterized protein n=2 Tax=Halodesulfovibrio spirochaetisodalis TaxID=1560234 RepID=A0A1B7XAX6_9BACT|nr:hypothetical protein SP90_12370 [Halodesulfovibrio spirochaetisodalis]
MKILLKKTGQVIHACEECDATWLSLEDIFDDEKGEDLIDYLETLGYIKEGIEVAWDDFSEDQGFVRLQDVEHIIKKYNIKIIPPTPL